MRRSPTLLLAIIGGLLAATVAAPASADDALREPDTVCAAAERAAFADRGTTHAAAIDCLTTLTDRDGAPILRGLTDGIFGTWRSVTRGQFASLVHRLLTVADPGLASAGVVAAFSDVDGTTHEEAILALADLGVLTGRSRERFAPHEPVTRGAAASTVARALEVAGSGLSERPRHAFADEGETHARAIGALADLGVVAGTTSRRFATDEPVTRGQAATLLARAAQLLEDEDAWAPDPTESRPEATAPAPPRPTPAAVRPPRRVAAIGDSITLGTGAATENEGFFDVLPGVSQPARSWATGTAEGLDSVLQRLRAAGARGARGVNLAENGARMADAVAQVTRTPLGSELLTVQLGGNDLCRPDLASMTDPDDYAAQLRAALGVLAERRPAALVQLSSVPDVYRLWEVLADDTTALAVWNGNGLLPPLVPCQSLLAEADSDAPADQARREAVRERGRELNRRLVEVCDAFPRCRHDDGAVWELTNDPDRFGDAEISNIDFFHPSFEGQRALARTAWRSGFDHTRDTPPQLTVEATEERVVVAATSATEVAGIEYRWLTQRQLRPTWSSSTAETLILPRDTDADALEVRALDVDGNVSAARIVDRSGP